MTKFFAFSPREKTYLNSLIPAAIPPQAEMAEGNKVNVFFGKS
jgi:hypothetical protein